MYDALLRPHWSKIRQSEKIDTEAGIIRVYVSVHVVLLSRTEKLESQPFLLLWTK